MNEYWREKLLNPVYKSIVLLKEEITTYGIEVDVLYLNYPLDDKTVSWDITTDSQSESVVDVFITSIHIIFQT